ncbi:MAG: hydroxyisourate hydrolase [Terrimicrobiaceae bacterium]|nr:hydroxyisourate hydrolase [Terrimicrobiaceae bacterium]
MSGKLSTHVLDLVRGRPAAGMRIGLAGEAGAILKTAITNADGRTDAPMLAPGELRCGVFELRFDVGGYFGDPEGFLGVVPVRFRITDAGLAWHIPLLCTPWSYSTYRGS